VGDTGLRKTMCGTVSSWLLWIVSYGCHTSRPRLGPSILSACYTHGTLSAIAFVLDLRSLSGPCFLVVLAAMLESPPPELSVCGRCWAVPPACQAQTFDMSLVFSPLDGGL
jgi:hypothetical protein